jgi:uncharacterized protein
MSTGSNLPAPILQPGPGPALPPPFPLLQLLLVFLLAFSSACTRQAASNPQADAAGASSPAPRQGQSRLPVIKLWLGPEEILAEQARASWEIEQGLMFRPSLPPKEGMLFIFSTPRPLSFWMRNTPIPLSIAYIDPDGVILEIHDMQPFDETPVQSRSANVQYALEMNQNWFRQHGIGPGTTLRTERGTLRETYGFSRR